MNFKAELTAMKGRLFSPELYQAMGDASTQRRRERGLTWKDAIWRRAQAQLDPPLTPDQKDRLDQLRRPCQEAGEYSAANARLMTQISLLYEAEQFTLKNVL